MKFLFIIFSLIFSIHSRGADFPNQINGLNSFRTHNTPGIGKSVIVVDSGFWGFDTNKIERVPCKDIKYANLDFIDNNFEESAEIERLLRRAIEEIEHERDFFAKNGLTINIDWEQGTISNYEDKNHKASKDDSLHLNLLAQHLKQYKEFMDLVETGHGLQVSRIVAGTHGIVPGANILPISTKNTFVRNLNMVADDGQPALPVNKALFIAGGLANIMNFDAINLSISLNCNQLEPSCISQYKLNAQLLEKVAEKMVVFYSLNNENNSFFGNLPGEQLIVKAAKNIAERHGYPRLIFIVNLQEESGGLLSGKAFHTADYTLANIGTYKAPRITNELETTEVNGTSFASPASMAQFLLLKEYLATKVKNVSDQLVINFMFEQADRFYKGKNLAMGFYGRGFMNMNKYAEDIKDFILSKTP